MICCQTWYVDELLGSVRGSPLSNICFFFSFFFKPLTETQSNEQGVAIVGLACRTAGGNNTPEKLWKFLLDERHASCEVPKQRWEPWRHRDPRNAKILDNVIRKGYFMEDLENFDAAFFGISPKEAELMDPHQRLALELTWEAVENSGVDPKSLAGSDTAVYMGVDSDDYSRMLIEDLPNIEAWSGIGTAAHGIPNRISYHLDLQGPSTAVDAACASSLIAIHLARQAILSGESTVAICGGVNVICAPGLTHMLQKAGALSPEGVCRSFDDGACGYARGEGGAVVVLKQLAAALADGDNILAVLKGSASAQDGKTKGIMAPNAAAQERVARLALQQSGIVNPLSISYVEAHATSTALGDPTEISAIASVYGKGRDPESPCWMGSIKPNIGHLEAAAGAIGFVKAVLSVNKGTLAPQTLLSKLNTKIDWDNSGLNVVREEMAWPKNLEDPTAPRRAAVCCYGYGGSVCHAIIEEPPALKSTGHNSIDISSPALPVTLVMSAPQEKRLSIAASALAEWLSSQGQSENLVEIARTLAQRRTMHDYRASFVVTDHEDAICALTKFSNGVRGQWVTSNRTKSSRKSVVWVYSGHGAQWQDMGKSLVNNPNFRSAIDEIEPVIQREATFSVLESLERGDLGDTAKIQILTFAMHIGLTALLKSHGIEPQAIIGHSVGEIAAAVVAGCITATEGAIIVSRRAKLYQQVEGQGAMALVNLPFDQVVNELGKRTDLVAAINSSPSSCIISGDPSALDAYTSVAHERGVETWKVRTDVAFHSPSMEDLAVPLLQALDQAIDPQQAQVTIYSTSHEDPRSRIQRDKAYWTNNMVAPVRLVEAIDAALEDGHHLFLEISSHPIVAHSISETLKTRRIDEAAVLGTMKRDTSAERSILSAVSQLFTLGARVDFGIQLGSENWSKAVPNTPWIHKKYWKTISELHIPKTQCHDVEKHTLLGKMTEIAGSDLKIWTTTLDQTSKPYPLTHPLDGTEIIPAAVYCNTFFQATGMAVLENLELKVPTPMSAEKRELQVCLQGDTVRLSSRLKGSGDLRDGGSLEHGWIEHCTAVVRSADMVIHHIKYPLQQTLQRMNSRLPNNFAWDYLQSIGVQGIAFPWAVLEHYSNDHEMLVHMDMDPDSSCLSWDTNSWAPFLDAATSVGSSIFHNSVRLRLVSGIDEVLFVSKDVPPKLGWLLIEDKSKGSELRADISILNDSGILLAKLTGMRFSDVEPTKETTTGTDKLVHRLAWVPPTFTESAFEFGNIVAVTTDKDFLKQFRPKFLAKHKLTCVSSSQELSSPLSQELLGSPNSIVLYIPASVDEIDEISGKAQAYTWEAARILDILSNSTTTSKLFVVTNYADPITALAHAPLQGFARVAASEYSNIWGGLIDCEDDDLPLLALKYVEGQAVIRIQDGLPRVPRLRPFTKAQQSRDSSRTLLPKRNGTYLVTGGFGDLGLEVLDFLVRKGARRVVVVSRRRLPPRKQWKEAVGQMKVVVERINKLESLGATIHAIECNVGSPAATTELVAQLQSLNLPPVRGVVHAAGISLDGFIKDTTSELFAKVMASKVQGALNLHSMFPPGSLDFMVLFSSIGQLLGTPGQAAYASSNAFLDALARQRRSEGCNSVAIQWTAWRNMGMAKDNDILGMELSSQGVTDITTKEAFQAWEYISKYDTDHAVVTRTRILDADEPIPCALVADIVERRTQSPGTPDLSCGTSSCASSMSSPITPRSGPALKAHLCSEVRHCLSTVLHLDAEEIDDSIAISDLGVDSVMTVALRQQLQKAMKVNVPPTLTWNYPTVGHLAGWFYEQLSE